MKTAFYAGSFDPPTLGHVHVIQRALEVFDKVIIGVGTNPAKRGSHMFTPEERSNMLWDLIGKSNAGVIIYDGYLVHAAIDHKCGFIVRGIRNGRDLEDEMAMAELNRRIALSHPAVNSVGIPQTVFIPTPTTLALVSSSMVKSLIGFGDWQEQISPYVPAVTYEAILRKYDSRLV